MKLLAISTYADIIGVEHSVWTRCKALRLVENKGTDAFRAYIKATTLTARSEAVFEKIVR